MAFRHFQGLWEERSVPLLLIRLCVPQTDDILVGVPPRLAIFDRPTAVTAAMGPAKHVASQGRLVCNVRNGCGKLTLEPDVLHILKIVKAMHMHSAAAMVILRRQLSLATLKLKPLEVIDDGLDAALLRPAESRQEDDPSSRPALKSC